MKAQDITFFINEWGKGIVSIGKFNESPVKQKEVTEKFVHKFYGYDDSKVLFKPTKAHKIQFRQTFDGAVSYFIGNNPDFLKIKDLQKNRGTLFVLNLKMSR